MTSRSEKLGLVAIQFFVLVVLIFLFSTIVFAQEFCIAASSIDEAPFFVGQSYSDILHRVPDRPGQLLYIGSLEGLNTANCNSVDPALSAGSCEWSNNNAHIAMALLSSNESLAKNGSLTSNTAFVTALYELLLQRAPDSAGLNWYLSGLNSGTSRLNVLSLFLTSSEYRKRFTCTYGATNPSCNGAESVDPVPSFVSQTYMDVLDRPFDDPGLAWWSSYMTTNQLAMCANTSGSDFSVCDRVFEAQTTLNFFETNEYQQLNPPITQNVAFVTALYQHLLQRAPDEPGLQLYTNYLDQTSDRLGTIYAFLNSKEYRKRFACYAGASDKLNFGINGHPLNPQDPAYSNSVGIDFGTQLRLLQNAGLKWYRVDVSAPTSGADYSQLDLLLSMAQTSGVQVLPILVPVADLSNDTPAQLYAKSYAGAFNIVDRYKTSIHVWELWNEGDVFSLYEPGDPYGSGTWPYGPPPGDSTGDFYPPRFAIAEAIIHGLADGARAADPGSLRIVNFAWLHTGFIQQLENDAIPYDVIGIHWYADAESTGNVGMGDITCPGQFLPCPAQPINFNVIQRVQTLTGGKPLWVTENNYIPISSNADSTNIDWEQRYLAPVLQSYLNSPSAYPYQTVMVYELLDEPNQQGGPNYSQMGLYQVTQPISGSFILGAPKPAYQSVQQVVTNQ